MVFLCPFNCGEEFSKNRSLRIHKISIHKDESSLFTCEKCSKKFTTNSGVYRHPCPKGELVKCRMCPYVGSLVTVKRHMLTKHFNTSKVKCEKCKQMYCTPGTLKRHRCRYLRRDYNELNVENWSSTHKPVISKRIFNKDGDHASSTNSNQTQQSNEVISERIFNKDGDHASSTNSNQAQQSNEEDVIPVLPESTKTIQVTERQMSRLSDVVAPQGIMAVFDLPPAVACHEDAIPLIIYLDKLQDPGNIGTIVRSAAGAACASVITSPNSADLWLPATLRASAAAHFLIPLHQGVSFREVLDSIPPDWNICFVESKNDNTTNTTRKNIGSIPYYEADFTQPTVMVFGKEGGGVSHAIREDATRLGCHNIINTYIPTIPELDSLNVGMAATVLIYEMAKQQRTLVKKDTSSILDNLPTISNLLNDVKETNTELSEVAQELESLFPPQKEELQKEEPQKEELQEEQGELIN